MTHDEMLKRIDDYYDRTTPEQFMKDLEETGCSHMVEDVSPENKARGIPMHRITESERTPEEQENFNKIIKSMHERGRQALKGEQK